MGATEEVGAMGAEGATGDVGTAEATGAVGAMGAAQHMASQVAIKSIKDVLMGILKMDLLTFIQL